MSETFKVFVVDDEPLVLDAIGRILAADYAVETFSSAETCRQRLDSETPDLFLLDVRMPGTDGYAFCRQIKDDARWRQIPVTFVSSQDTIDARSKGYDAGGQDFIVKPFATLEILRKVQVAQKLAHGKQSLVQQLEESEQLSSLVMANMDEYAILLNFMRQLIGLESEQEIATGLLTLLQRYRLHGVVQTRISRRILTVSEQGTNVPLETSILDHVRSMGRIFEFRNRSVHNFERLTLMIHDMPLDDSELCGRIRDHLCIAAESVEARLKAIESEESNRRNQAGIHEAIERIGRSTRDARDNYLRDRAACAELLMFLEQDFAKWFAHIEMTERDELTLSGLVNAFSEKMLALLDGGEDAQQAMEEMGRRLWQLNPAT